MKDILRNLSVCRVKSMVTLKILQNGRSTILSHWLIVFESTYTWSGSQAHFRVWWF
jgi:hypothetical protein